MKPMCFTADRSHRLNQSIVGRWSLAAFVLAASFSSQPLAAQTPAGDGYANELPRIGATEPAEALKELVVKPGYRLELAAEEPLVRDPVAMAFDEDSRLFVVEMCDYSEQDKDFLGTIKLLEDKDGDGHFESSFTYAEKLSWPTGVICYDGGIFVAAAPDIWYLKDTDGDGVADEKRIVYTGFGRTNVQGLLNSFCWGLDNRIYCQISSSGASISRPDKPDVAPVNANGRDFSFDPKTLDFRLESGGGQHGMSFDDWGRRFTCHNSDHLQMFLYSDRYSRSNAPFPLPPSRRSIAEDGPQANVYRISPVEPWRIVRTRLRVTNETPGAIEGGGRAAGYFTSATGVTIYRGNTYPDDMQGVAFIGDVGSNIVHRKTISDSGVAMIGRRIDHESEFVASTDIWFRPVQFANSPDGNIYVADLYREVIEHPLSLPPEIKQHLDLTSGRDRGRIYRIVPENYQRASLPKLASASIDELLVALQNPNGWHRDTASRLLYEHFTSGISRTAKEDLTAKLTAIAKKAPLAQARLHALGLLHCCTERTEGLIAALEDEHPRVRESAIAYLENEFSNNPKIVPQLAKLAVDRDPRIRFQLALSLSISDLPKNTRADLAYAILKASDNDNYILTACFNAIGDQAVEILENELAKKDATTSDLSLTRLAQISGKLGSKEQLSKLDALFVEAGMSQQATGKSDRLRSIAIQIIDALQVRYPDPSELAAFLGSMPATQDLRTALTATARAKVADTSLDISERLQALQYLMWNVSDADVGLLASLFRQQESQELQSSAGQSLRKLSTPDVAKELLDQWSSITPKLRSAVIDIIFTRPAWIDILLDYAENDKFNLVDLDVVRLNSLRNGARTKARAEKLVSSSQVGSRADVFENYRAALTMEGDSVRGKEVFAKACAACHRVEGVGYEIAPNLVSFQFRGAEAILQNVIEPNREVNPQYVSYTILTKDDRILTGMITNESAASVTLTRGDDLYETVERSEIEEMRSSRLSLMPEGLEQQIDLQSMADLLAYLMSVK